MLCAWGGDRWLREPGSLRAVCGPEYSTSVTLRRHLPRPDMAWHAGSGLSALLLSCPPCVGSRGAQVAPSRSPGVSDQRVRRRFQDPEVHLAWATLDGQTDRY